ncbi:MAG: hypothetical protein IIA50_03905 [Bacteroidetes bacterium]|nr:hypothetical protein [Bacteroidota bacterium]
MFSGKEKKNQRGEHPIYLRIEADNRREDISLRIYVRPRHGNPNKSRLRSLLNGYKDIESINAARITIGTGVFKYCELT